MRGDAYAFHVPIVENSLFAKEIKVPVELHLPKVYRLSRFDYRTISTWMPYHFDVLRIADTDVFYLKYYPKMFTDPKVYFDFTSFLLHESFHAYKQKDWTYDINGADHISNYPANRENYALIGVEFKLLDQAMASDQPDKVKEILKDWTIVRSYRYQQWPQLIGESYAEAIEGSARYIEYRYSQLIGGHHYVLATKHAPYHITFMQAYNYIANGLAESPVFFERTMAYETGSSLQLMMDNAGIPWKAAIEDRADKPGKTQYEILRAYFQVSDKVAADDNNIVRIKDNNDFTALLELGEKIVKINSHNQ